MDKVINRTFSGGIVEASNQNKERLEVIEKAFAKNYFKAEFTCTASRWEMQVLKG